MRQIKFQKIWRQWDVWKHRLEVVFVRIWLWGFFLLREGSISAQGIHTPLDILFCSDSLCHYERKSYSYWPFFIPLSMYVHTSYNIYRGKELKELETIFSTEIGQNLTELGTGTFKIHKDTKVFRDFFLVKFLRRGNSFAHGNRIAPLPNIPDIKTSHSNILWQSLYRCKIKQTLIMPMLIAQLLFSISSAVLTFQICQYFSKGWLVCQLRWPAF